MEFFTEHNVWDQRLGEVQPAGGQLLAPNDTANPHGTSTLSQHQHGHLDAPRPHGNGLAVSEGEAGMASDHDLALFDQEIQNEQYFSPALSYEDTPLLSPHALAPQQPIGYARVQTASGKIVKQSPSVRWKPGSVPEDEFRLGDPALEVFDGNTTLPQADYDDHLQSAIVATTRASSTSSRHYSSSRRASSVSSQRNTPRIRPKIAPAQAAPGNVSTGSISANSSANPSPLMNPNDGDIADEAPFMKSNYQNLVDGTHQHLGLVSADRMVTELRSKKTVHKLAEQERRNRMNTAIIDLANELPPTDEKAIASKASTVERATQHIRLLKARIAELEGASASGSRSETNETDRGSAKRTPNGKATASPPTARHDEGRRGASAPTSSDSELDSAARGRTGQ